MTGASEGIGRGYALEVHIITCCFSPTNDCFSLQLARQGLNVVLMSRSEEKLNKVATEISELNRGLRKS